MNNEKCKLSNEFLITSEFDIKLESVVLKSLLYAVDFAIRIEK